MARTVRWACLKAQPVPVALFTLLVLSLVPLVQPAAKDVTGIADASGDGEPDVATFAEANDPSGVSVDLYSGANGKRFRTLNLFDNRFDGIALERIREMPGTGQPALAALGTNRTNGRHEVEIFDPVTGDLIAEHRILNSVWDMVDLTIIDDLNGDGVLDDPALAVLARLVSRGKIVVQIIRLSDGVVIGNRSFLNRLWTPIAVAAVSRAGMPSLLAILAVNPNSNRMVVQSRFVSNGALQRNSRPLNSVWGGLDLAALQDRNGDGTLDDPVWLVLARNPNSGANVVHAIGVADGLFVSNVFVLNTFWRSNHLSTSTDLNGNNFEELLAAARNASTDSPVIQFRDFMNGQTIRSIRPPHVQPPVANADDALLFFQTGDGGLLAVDPLNPTAPPMMVDPDAAPPPSPIVATATSIPSGNYDAATVTVSNIRTRRIFYSRTDGTLWHVAADRASTDTLAETPTPVQVSSEAEAMQLCSAAPVPWGVTDIAQLQVYYLLPGPDQECASTDDNFWRVVTLGMDSSQTPMDFPGEFLDNGTQLINPTNGEFAGWLAQDANALLHVAPDLSTTQLASLTNFVDSFGQVRTGHVLLNLDGNLQILDLLGGGALIDSGYDFPRDPTAGARRNPTVQTDGERWLFIAPTDLSDAALLSADATGQVQILHEPLDATSSLSTHGPVFTDQRIIYQYASNGGGFANKILSLTREGSGSITLHDGDFAISLTSAHAYGLTNHVVFQTLGFASSTLYIVRDDGSEAPTILENSDTIGVKTPATQSALSARLTTADSVFILEGVGVANSAGGARLSALDPSDANSQLSYGEIPDEFDFLLFLATTGRYKLVQATESVTLTTRQSDIFFLDTETTNSLLRLTDTADVSELPIILQ